MAQPSALDALCAYVRRLQINRFWGDVTINLKNGDITLVDIHQAVKPEALPSASQPIKTEDRPTNGYTS